MTRYLKNTIIMAAASLSMLTGSIGATAGTISGSVKARGLRTLNDVVVYITKVPGTAASQETQKIVMDQKNLSFLPHVLVVPAGASVHFPNNDEVDHNVFSLSRTKTFNLGTYGPGGTKSVVFDKPGLVELRCDMHAEMSAYILVLKNSFFGVTDKKGRFSIPDDRYLTQIGIKSIRDLPAGKYVIKTWHKKLRSSRKTVTVPKSGNVVIDLQLKRGTPGALFKR